MTVMFMVNVALLLVFLLAGVALFTPRSGKVRHEKSETHGNRAISPTVADGGEDPFDPRGRVERSGRCV